MDPAPQARRTWKNFFAGRPKPLTTNTHPRSTWSRIFSGQKKSPSPTDILFDGVRKGSLQLVLKALEMGADTNVKITANKYLNTYFSEEKDITSLFLASLLGHETIVEELLNRGADPNIQSLVLSYQEGSYRTRVQVREQFSPLVGTTPIWVASQEGYHGIVKKLIEKGAIIDYKKDKDGKAILDAEGKRQYIGSGAPVLFVACQNGHLEVVKELINNGADPNFRRAQVYPFPENTYIDIYGLEYWKPLDIASDFGHQDIVEFLKEKGGISGKVLNGKSNEEIYCYDSYTQKRVTCPISDNQDSPRWPYHFDRAWNLKPKTEKQGGGRRNRKTRKNSKRKSRRIR